MPENGSSPKISYLGRHEHGVDGKRRLQIPARWRSEQESVFRIILWEAGESDVKCLMVLPPRAYELMEQRLLEMPFGDPKTERMLRILGGDSDEVTVDKVGRMSLPVELAKGAGIVAGERVMLRGLVTRFQIWSLENHQRIEGLDQVHNSEARRLVP